MVGGRWGDSVEHLPFSFDFKYLYLFYFTRVSEGRFLLCFVKGHRSLWFPLWFDTFAVCYMLMVCLDSFLFQGAIAKYDSSPPSFGSRGTKYILII